MHCIHLTQDINSHLRVTGVILLGKLTLTDLSNNPMVVRTWGRLGPSESLDSEKGLDKCFQSKELQVGCPRDNSIQLLGKAQHSGASRAHK